MTREVVERWLDAHDAAWRSASAAEIADLFNEDAVYHLGPWDAPWRGLPGPFRGGTRSQRAGSPAGSPPERFATESEILAVEGRRAVVRRRITCFEDDGSVETATTRAGSSTSTPTVAAPVPGVV